MVVEETPRSTITEDQNIPNPNPRVHDEEEAEEGEIVSEDDSSPSAKPSMEIPNQQHPLENSWTFWFDSPAAKSKAASWGSSLRPIYTFSTVEEFWSLYNNIRHPSKLADSADFYCFKHKIEPKWEDPVCANGGKWGVSFNRGKSDTSWLYTLLAMIGEQFDHGDEICGAVVNIRKGQEKLGIWTKNASNENAQMSIGKQWREFLNYNESMGFIVHEDAGKFGRAAKSRYTI